MMPQDVGYQCQFIPDNRGSVMRQIKAILRAIFPIRKPESAHRLDTSHTRALKPNLKRLLLTKETL